MASTTNSSFVKNDIGELFFSEFKEGSLLICENIEGKQKSAVVLFYDRAQYSNVLGKKREDPTVFICLLIESKRKIAMVVKDLKKEKFIIFFDIKNNPYEVINIITP